MHLDELLTAAVLLLGASAAAIAAVPARRLRLGAGPARRRRGARARIRVGPVVDIGPIAAAAELGVVFLLFVIGLELEPARIWAMRRHAVRARHAAGRAHRRRAGRVALGVGRPWPAAIVLGFGLALSSTAFVLQLLAERDELATEHGRAALAILLLQDMAVIPLLAMVPLLAPVPTSPMPPRSAGARWLSPLTLAAHRRARPHRAAARICHPRPAAQRRRRSPSSPCWRCWPRHGWRTMPGCRRRWAPSWSASCSRARRSITRSPPRSRPSRACCSACSSSRSACRSTCRLLRERWAEILGLVAGPDPAQGRCDLAVCAACSGSHAGALRTSLLLTQGGEFGFVLFGAAAASG